MFPSTKGPCVHLLVHLPYLFIFFSFTLRVTQIATATLFYSFNLSTTDFLFCFYLFIYLFILMERVLTTTSEIANLGKPKNIADKQRPVLINRVKRL